MKNLLKVPVGAILMHASSQAPSGWLLCDGGTFDGNSYPKLAELLSDTYGIISGTSYFLPDFRGRIPISNISTTVNNRKVGLESVTLTGSQSPIAAHIHNDTVSLGTHTHTSTARRASSIVNSVTRNSSGSGGQVLIGTTTSTFSNGSIFPSSPVPNLVNESNTETDAASPHDNIMPSLVVNFIIKSN
jgi:microcystin-dependent protein